jgi:chaperonin GroES
MTKLKPLGDRVIVQALKEEEVTKAGIVLPDTAEKEKKEQGKIIAIGNGEKVKKLGLKKGDQVLFGKYSGEDIKIGDEEYKVLKEEDILAVIE